MLVGGWGVAVERDWTSSLPGFILPSLVSIYFTNTRVPAEGIVTFAHTPLSLFIAILWSFTNN